MPGIVVGTAVVVVLPAGDVVVVLPLGEVVVVLLLGEVVVVVPIEVVVVELPPGEVVVVVDVVTQPGRVMTLLSRLIWPLRASTRPLTIVPVCTVAEVKAKTFPAKVE